MLSGGEMLYLVGSFTFTLSELRLSIYCDGAVLEIYLNHKFQLPLDGLNCESLAYEVVTLPTRP